MIKLDKVTLYVKSQEEAKKFWIDKVGFVLTFEQQMAPGMTWIEVAPQAGQPSLVLYSKEAMQKMNPAMVSHPSIIFEAADVEKTHREMKAKGVDVADLQIMPYGKMFQFKDQDGNMYLVRNPQAPR